MQRVRDARLRAARLFWEECSPRYFMVAKYLQVTLLYSVRAVTLNPCTRLSVLLEERPLPIMAVTNKLETLSPGSLCPSKGFHAYS